MLIEENEGLRGRWSQDLESLTEGKIRVFGLVGVPTVAVHIAVYRNTSHPRSQDRRPQLGNTLVRRTFVDSKSLVVIPQQSRRRFQQIHIGTIPGVDQELAADPPRVACAVPVRNDSVAV